ncbi:MAG: hypothetical protein ACYC1C_17235 [Chloroflexota bacterium]
MRRERTLGEAVVGGMIGGLIGAMAMVPMMQMMKAMGLTREVFPKVVTRGLAERAGLEQAAQEPLLAPLAYASHLLYGAGLGAVFGAIQRTWHLTTFPFAPLFGLFSYVIGFMGWLPALGIIPPLWRQQQPAGVMRMMGHIFYGLVLGMVFSRDRGVALRLVSGTGQARREVKEGRRAA